MNRASLALSVSVLIILILFTNATMFDHEANQKNVSLNTDSSVTSHENINYDASRDIIINIPGTFDEFIFSSSAYLLKSDDTTLKQNAIEKAVIRLINRTPKGEKIRIAIYQFTSIRIAEAIVKARNRGVDVKIIYGSAGGIFKDNTDTSSETDANAESKFKEIFCEHFKVNDPVCANYEFNKITKRKIILDDDKAFAMMTEVDEGSYFVRCGGKRGLGSCLGDETVAINHNKFMIISKNCKKMLNSEGVCVGRENQISNVVFQSTQNFTFIENSMHNTAAIFYGKRDLYEAYMQYHKKMFRVKDNSNKKNFSEYGIRKNSQKLFEYPLLDDDKLRLKMTTFPRNPNEDVLLAQLNDVHFVQGLECTVRVMMPHWNGRPAVIERLVELNRKGCQVKVLMSKKALYLNEPANVAYKKLMAGNIEVGVAPEKKNKETYTAGVHSKLLLIKSPLHSDTSNFVHRRVLFGSHTFSDNSLLQNDEVWLDVEQTKNTNIYDAASDSFYELKELFLDK